jgi:hypothetical protein
MALAAFTLVIVLLVVFLAGASLLAVTAIKKRKAKEDASQHPAAS